MMILVTYDVNTETKQGRKRLRHVANLCVDYGQRVQNSVFECSVVPAEFVELKGKLADIINPELDSIRFYLLGKNWQNRVEQMGNNDSYDPDKDVLLL
ncbi:CRISPR-associated endonuclease Cas2 [Tetragenococcus koreensis]|uniref:CRISPR-associated endoribonuclease Cas2 n=1 Tax=Tetragenococcus koreensis TaxID=290335 RepID=A0AAN4RLS5_9ENTE|nr:CRISPR-associated endonuclease Cas2 [Tetragenococcus koreensis]AYW46551.1 CRISPR-associated endonuclease Cas2 [Tetragenococcus koreensis]MCF1585638.1 CRISPR-associated endonuclease Cas2 [Tetragenococcus koreensis]MCF1615250.1 CRISPR-associated endonuclease Cas2 [Tetragenococcus koreensis]MCF1617511.1 CRISPR-associated endonuclease Cas2 [Tetragenococcus koreensis]MCF1620285.1 CRISPR-associated endonuclease Cas2 [Tetragenococcus koreensis]